MKDTGVKLGVNMVMSGLKGMKPGQRIGHKTKGVLIGSATAGMASAPIVATLFRNKGVVRTVLPLLNDDVPEDAAIFLLNTIRDKKYDTLQTEINGETPLQAFFKPGVTMKEITTARNQGVKAERIATSAFVAGSMGVGAVAGTGMGAITGMFANKVSAKQYLEAVKTAEDMFRASGLDPSQAKGMCDNIMKTNTAAKQDPANLIAIVNEVIKGLVQQQYKA